MNKPALKATQLLESIGSPKPSEMTIEEIAYSQNAYLNYKPIDGSEGRILINGNSAIITVNSDITYEPKIKFVIAHELGHFILHKQKEKLYLDTNKTLSQWRSNGIIEKEANEFAAELLMPTDSYKEKVMDKVPDIESIKGVSEYFGTSLTASLIRYCQIGKHPVMIVCSENGLIKWSYRSDDFPLTWMPAGSEVPINTVAGDYFKGFGIEDTPVKINATEWFLDDYNIGNHKNLELIEHCFCPSPLSVISCLWLV